MNIKVLELYSGVGGVHMAMNDAALGLSVVAAVDINTTANSVYRLNFPHTLHLQRNIQALTAAELDKLQPDMITMSPPCQPFSRLGKQGDVADARTGSLLHLLRQLPLMRRPPRLLLLENVRGFERSAARTALLCTLRELGLHWREMLLSPHQLGVPNSRTRYYLVARRDPFPFPAPTDDSEVPTECAFCVCLGVRLKEPADGLCPYCDKTRLQPLSDYLNTCTTARQHTTGGPACDVSEFLSADAEEAAELRVPDGTLARYGRLLDVVSPSSRRCCCFTSGYTRLAEGAGSVLAPDGSGTALEAAYRAADALPADDAAGRADCLRPLQLRYFSPREVARLMCFPEHFQLPEHLSRRHRYKLLGNSVNVRTVAVMLLILLHS